MSSLNTPDQLSFWRKYSHCWAAVTVLQIRLLQKKSDLFQTKITVDSAVSWSYHCQIVWGFFFYFISTDCPEPFVNVIWLLLQVRAHFTAIAPSPCPSMSGLCAAGEDCLVHTTSVPFNGSEPKSGWCVRQWQKTVASNYNSNITLGYETCIHRPPPHNSYFFVSPLVPSTLKCFH